MEEDWVTDRIFKGNVEDDFVDISAMSDSFEPLLVGVDSLSFYAMNLFVAFREKITFKKVIRLNSAKNR